MIPRTAVAVSRLALVGLALLAHVAPSAAAGPLEAATVRIVNHSQRPNWYAPWVAPLSRRSSGSGFVVEGGLVMTNAHVVSDARHVQIYMNGDPSPHEARVRFVGHDCDLALLEPIEEDLLRSTPALSFGTLPSLGSTVETFGYPTGSTQISSTRGVVSRIDVQLYAHSGLDRHIAVQTDAAINPGNSGGPVVQAGRVVGVAFQATPDLENVGFFIPTEIVRHFLDDVADGSYDGYPELGAITAALENPAARRRLGLGDGETGVRVMLISPGTSAYERLARDDVLLEVDGHPIANDGTVSRRGLRLDYGVLIDSHQVGESIRLRVLRGGERLDLEVALARFAGFDRWANQYDQLPRYYVYAGLVFLPFGREILETFGDDWSRAADAHLRYEHFARFLVDPESLATEPVIFTRRLDHPVNADQAWSKDMIVERVNGRKIESLNDLVSAIESHDGPYHVIEFAYYDRFIVLDRAASDAAHQEILDAYGVPEDRRL